MKRSARAFTSVVGLVTILVSQSVGADWTDFMDVFKSEGKEGTR
jgi:hypothetical protein